MKRILLLLLLAGLSTNAEARIRTNIIDPANGKIKIKNVAGFAYDYTNFMLSISGTYFILSNLNITQGNLNAGIDEEIEISGLSLPAAASVALWYPNSLPSNASAGNLVDFMQYGSAGHDYESIAVMAGFWMAGQFVAGDPPYMRNGQANDEGAGFWQSNTIGVTSLQIINMEFYPNPVDEKLCILLDGQWEYKKLSASLVDQQGSVVAESPLHGAATEMVTEKLASGTYFLFIRNEVGILERRRLVKH